MGELTEEATNLINGKVEELIKDHEDILTEMNAWKWALRTLFVVVLGGSIFGLVKLQDYVDDRVAKRVQRQDNLYLAAANSIYGDATAALERLDGFITEVGRKNDLNGLSVGKNGQAWDTTRISSEQQEFFFQLLVSILAITDKITEDGEFIGKHHWKTLLTDSSFKGKLESRLWESNVRFKFSMGRSYLHFADTKDDLTTARRYLEKALDLATSTNDESTVSTAKFNIGMIDVVNGEVKEGANRIAQSINWKQMYVPYSAYEPKSFLNGIDWQIYSRLWARFGKGNFEPQIANLIDLVWDSHKAAETDTRMSSIDLFDTPRKRKEFLDAVRKQYLKWDQAWKSKDRDALRGLLADASYESFSQMLEQKDTTFFPEVSTFDAAWVCSVAQGLGVPGVPEANSYILTVVFLQTGDEKTTPRMDITFVSNGSSEWKILSVEIPRSNSCRAW